MAQRDREHDPARARPDRMPAAPLDERETAAGVVVRRADRDGVHVAGADPVGDALRHEHPLERLLERRGVEQPDGERLPEQTPEREVPEQRRRAAAERGQVRAEHLLDAELRPDPSDLGSGRAELRAAAGEDRAVDRARGGVRDDAKGRRRAAEARQFRDAPESPAWYAPRAPPTVSTSPNTRE
jgi:hypothetical protein